MREQRIGCGAVRLWLACALALLVALLPPPQVGESGPRGWLATASPALVAHHGREFVVRQDAVQIRHLTPTGMSPPGLAPPAPRVGVGLSFAHAPVRCPALRPVRPCARGPPAAS